MLIKPGAQTYYVGDTRIPWDPANRHEKYHAQVKRAKLFFALLKTVMKVSPTPQEVWGFRGKALEYAKHMKAAFPEHKVFNYEHFIVCHAWELLEKYGTIGAYSSIVCEACNAVWKDVVLHHCNNAEGSSMPIMKTVAIRNCRAPDPQVRAAPV